nr:RNA-directed DNA polymerase, eukaryota [Tanacetum cinerariifolium]
MVLRWQSCHDGVAVTMVSRWCHGSALANGAPLAPAVDNRPVTTSAQSSQNPAEVQVIEEHSGTAMFGNLNSRLAISFYVAGVLHNKEGNVFRDTVLCVCPIDQLCGVKVGDCMSRQTAWVDTVHKLRSRLSNRKVKTLSIGGRLTLLKSVLGASHLYNMSIYKVPKGVLKEMEAIRRDGHSTQFWYDNWIFDQPLRDRDVRDGAEQQQWSDLNSLSWSVSLSSFKDRWICDLTSDGDFRVKEINVFAWRVRLDCLPTRSNLIRRGVILDSALCPLCDSTAEDIHHVLFRCDNAHIVFRMICRWWDLDLYA